jgi:signal peptidase II
MADRRPAYFVAALVFGLDQLTKWIVTGPLGISQHGDQLVLLPIFNLTYTENHGVSLGLLPANSDAARWLLVAMTADQIALGMVLGGALGNILDRVRFGYVVDFADLHFGEFRPFLVFNVGDASISIAVVVLLLRAFLVRKDKAEDADPEEKIEHA